MYIYIFPQNIREEMPEDPYEAEMLLLARASSESAQGETGETAVQENNSLPDGKIVALNICSKNFYCTKMKSIT